MVVPPNLAPRARNAALTRQAMLDAARGQFALESYENVGLREIAREAGVDPALVSRYFGSKEALFKEVLGGKDKNQLFEGVSGKEMPARFAELVLDADPDSDHSKQKLERLLIILRSASSPKACAIVRDAMGEDILDPVAQRLGGENAQFRASLALAVLMGSGIMRNIMSVRPLCDGDVDQVRAGLEKLFAAALNPD